VEGTVKSGFFSHQALTSLAHLVLHLPSPHSSSSTLQQ
jgi:hypothetical protein